MQYAVNDPALLIISTENQSGSDVRRWDLLRDDDIAGPELRIHAKARENKATVAVLLHV